ncbi:ATP-binding cassette domain-containing protein [Paracoccus sp. S-4012]|uniref:ABC transporter ATP-binding protein n=1 Tax=Paracoccus sp. S-4012 TaxID=2665648 RepID=UPI0012B0E445|nr:ABC transporter ATP-binding protein [Paracoccus sp. S-4012]MRX51152.1 ATP-binding cassette domain-containing protein [Paracoccus sp. S-4012]
MQSAAAPSLALLIEGVSRRLGGFELLREVNLTLGAGEVLCLVGPSGCGKSSLLRVIAGVDAADTGRILMGGRELAGPSVFVEPEQRGIGMMFQDYALFPHLTVAENLAFGLAALPRGAARARVEQVLARIGIAALAGRYPHSLSGGEQQRVALARALAPEPAVLLMDEPFSNLDRDLRARLRAETLAQLRAHDTAAIIVTHDPEEALSTGDRLAVMRAGRIVQQGPARQVYDHPADAFAATFLGPCTEVAGRVRDGRIATPLGPVPAPDGVPEGAAVVVMLRPEAIALGRDPAGVVARVREVAFVGAAETLNLAVEGLEQPVQARVPPGTAAIDERVRLSILPGRAMIFRSS